jgi:hypothetical protein
MRIRDVIRHPRQPAQRVHRLEIPAQARIGPQAPADNGLLPIQVDQPLEGQWVSDDVARQVLDGLGVPRRDRVPEVDRVAGMPPSGHLGRQLVREGVLGNQPREKTLAKQTHDGLTVPRAEQAEHLVREAAIRHENVEVRMPLHHVARGGE